MSERGDLFKRILALTIILLLILTEVYFSFSLRVGSKVGTSTTTNAMEEPTQRKSFYASGLFWVFYSDGTNMVYSTSGDGNNWTSPTIVRECGAGYRFSIFYDDTYIHYACVQTFLETSLLYRRGIPRYNSTISWSAEEQVAVPGEINIRYRDPMIAVDSSGYALVSYKRSNNSDSTTYPWITKSGNNNGTWGTTPNPFPYQLDSILSRVSWNYVITPLTDNKFYITYGVSNAKLCGRLYDNGMGEEETVTSSTLGQTWQHSTTNEGDHVHLVFKKRVSHELIYVNRTYESGWGIEEEIQLATESSVSPVLSIHASTGDLYCFWIRTDGYVYYKKRSGEIWDVSPTTWFDESVNSITGVDKISCFYRDYGGKIGCVFMTNSTSPYEIHFGFITL